MTRADPRDVPTGVRWWQSAVFYQIYPRSFSDTTGNGVGDLPGITSKLDHLTWLGVDALWVSPFFRSPMADYGYDVADYCDVDPLFGSLEDFDALLEAAHARALRVIIDWVPAHTSIEHPWFEASRSSRDDPKRDWYVWRDPGPGGALPNNWTAAFGDPPPPTWTLDETTGQLYLHSFLKEQPDLNWANPDVREAMLDTLRFWLDRGVDGFRMDVIHNIGKDPELSDAPEALARIPHCALNDEPLTHEYLREIRAVLDEYPGDRVAVGEVFLLSTAQVAPYYGSPDAQELHLSFNFPPLFAAWEADAWRRCIDETVGILEPVSGWPTWVLSNHDQKRHRTRYGSEAHARMAAVLLLGLRGTPFMYMGEELGLGDAIIPLERKVDPGNRDGCRAPIPWTREPGHGWPGEPWLPWPPEATARSCEALRGDPDSILHLYRRLLASRRASPALRIGDQRNLVAPEGLLAWERRHGGDRRVVLLNFLDEAVDYDVREQVDLETKAPEIEIASDGIGDGCLYAGKIDPKQALILR